jgi:shikimate kinase
MENDPTTEHKPNLVLSGFMGTGKSTIGRILAQRLNMQFADTDTQIESEAGMTVSEIFRVHGESAFREMEHDMCERLSNCHNYVIATGGGALLNPASRAALERTGVLILLTCDQQTLLQRLQESARRGERPLLRHDLEDAIASIMQQREPAYSTISLKVDTTQLTPEQAADAALELYLASIPVTWK